MKYITLSLREIQNFAVYMFSKLNKHDIIQLLSATVPIAYRLYIHMQYNELALYCFRSITFKSYSFE